MKLPSILIGSAIVAAVSSAYVPTSWLKGISNRPVKEPTVESQPTVELEATAPTIEPQPSPQTANGDTGGQPNGAEQESPKSDGGFSGPIRLYLDNLGQMVADMKSVASEQEAANYENKFRMEMPRMSTNALVCIAALTQLETAVQSGKLTLEIVRAGEMLNDFEVKGAAVEDEMVRLVAIHPPLKMLFDQYRSLFELPESTTAQE